MTNLPARQALRARLPRSWHAFFARYGNFTAPQLAAMPLLLDGENVMLCAATASGKTEAALAPLIELHCPATSSETALRILYLTPARALAADLAARLEQPLHALAIPFAVKTGDWQSLHAGRPPGVLITTPESLDSLLTSQARLFVDLRAIIIDELHLVHGTPRGDQLQLLLQRLRHVREYATTAGVIGSSRIQFAALSATLTEPEVVARSYFEDARVIVVPGRRPLRIDYISLPTEGAAGLLAFLQTLQGKGIRKVLAFCNTRAEVEAYASAVRAGSPFGDAVYVHYSNIEARRRREIEQRFAVDEAAICFASTTLELGIDIGSIDLVLLLGPPGSVASFVQRVGRGNRRKTYTAVACCDRSPLERLIFTALVSSAGSDVPVELAPGHLPFRPAVAIQQIFSLLKQSPTGSIRLAELGRLFADRLSGLDLRAIVGQLQLRRYLAVGRPGEWRAGPRLNQLLDQQARAQPSLSIYSNIQGAAGSVIEVRDQTTQQTVARVDASWFDQPALTLEGRPVNVEWFDGDVMWVAGGGRHERPDQLPYRSARQLLRYHLAQLLPAQLGLTVDVAPIVAAPDGYWWFHWLGDIYGRLLLDLLQAYVPVASSPQPGLCLHLTEQVLMLPTWTEQELREYLANHCYTFEPMLDLGPFQHLLPDSLRRQSVIDQLDVPGFLQAVALLRPTTVVEPLATDLLTLLHDPSQML